MSKNSATDTLRKDMGQLRKEFASLRNSVRQHSADGLHAGIDKARKGGKTVGSEIEGRPYVSIMTAFGIGLLLGWLFRRWPS